MTIGSGNSSDARANSASPPGAASRDRLHVGGLVPRRAPSSVSMKRSGPKRSFGRVSGRWPRGSRRSASRERLLDGPDKARLLRTIEGARPSIPLRGILRFLHLSPSRFYAWRRRQRACALSDQRSCPRVSPHRLTRGEVHAIEGMVTSLAYRHVPTRTLAVLAQRLGTVCASPSTWYRLVRTHGWRRPRLRIHPAKPKVGLRTTPGRGVAHRHHRHPAA